jgi:Zn-finger nucleic acid-binding protein
MDAAEQGTIVCPLCNTRLVLKSVSESARRVKCPKCQGAFELAGVSASKPLVKGSPAAEQGRREGTTRAQAQAAAELPGASSVGNTVKWECPHCRARLESPVEKGGRTDRCPICGAECSVPLSAAQRVQREREQKRLAGQRQPDQEQRKPVTRTPGAEPCAGPGSLSRPQEDTGQCRIGPRIALIVMGVWNLLIAACMVALVIQAVREARDSPFLPTELASSMQYYFHFTVASGAAMALLLVASAAGYVRVGLSFSTVDNSVCSGESLPGT